MVVKVRMALPLSNGGGGQGLSCLITPLDPPLKGTGAYPYIHNSVLLRFDSNELSWEISGD